MERMDFVNDRNSNLAKINLMLLYLCHGKAISGGLQEAGWEGCMATLVPYTYPV